MQSLKHKQNKPESGGHKEAHLLQQMDFSELMNSTLAFIHSFIHTFVSYNVQCCASQHSKAPTLCVTLVQEYNSMYKDSPFKIDAK